LEWLLQVMCIEVEPQRLVLRHPVLPPLHALVAVRDDLLRDPAQAWPVAVFMQDAGATDALEWNGIYFERSNRAAVLLPLLLAIAALLLMLSSFVYLPVWLVQWWRGGPRPDAAHMLPLAASALFFATLLLATRLELSLLDSMNAV